MKVLKLSVLVIVLTVIVYLLWSLNDQTIHVRELEVSRRRICFDRYRGTPRPSSYSERNLFKSTCEMLMSVCERKRIVGLEEYCIFLASCDKPVSIGSAEAVGDEMKKIFNKSFLFTKKGLLEFESAGDFKNYASVNYNLAMYYGDVNVRRGGYELLPAIEYLIYERFKSYEEHFYAKGQTELGEIASDFKRQIIEHIESSEGFTRQAARHMVLLNTEYAEIMHPGCGLSKLSAIRYGRSFANGLVNVGYTPKWLDIEYPLK